MEGNKAAYSAVQQPTGRPGTGTGHVGGQGTTYASVQANGQGNGYGGTPADVNALSGAFGGLSFHGMNMPANQAHMPVGPGGPWIMGSNYVGGLNGLQGVSMGAQHDNPTMGAGFGGAGFAGPYYGMGIPSMGMPAYTGVNVRTNVHHPARLERGHSDNVPGLENRRGSYSTTESTPATPYWAGFSHREPGPRVASHDRSAYTTPSPQAIVFDVPKPVSAPISESALVALLEQDPPVPKAVPAVFTPPGQMKTLEQSLENRIPGNRNVYIRGLHPTTDDELLYLFSARFGAVETSKAIIDTGTGACKGFGFAKFYDVRDSEMCIRGFHHLGYEVGFARESFNSRLKAQGDGGSTNLYISNLPKNMTEVELGIIFREKEIVSSKILRDSMGNSRGVGFARFNDRHDCDEIIREYNGRALGEEGLLMNIRYADTPAQKELKRVTAERRQFRTNEYNIGAYGTPLVGLSNTSLYGQQGQWRRSTNDNSLPTST